MQERKMAIDNMIMKSVTGSMLYGTNTEDSDEDYIGVFIAENEYYYGLKNIEQVILSEQIKNEAGKNTKDSVDFTVYELKKFINLAMQNNPNIVELLFSNKILVNSVYWNQIIDNRQAFIHKGLKDRFIGYALSQKAKMHIKRENYYNLLNSCEYLKHFTGKLIADVQYLSATIKPDADVNMVWNDKQMIIKQVGDGTQDLCYDKNWAVKKVVQQLEQRLNKFSSRKELIDKYGFDSKYGSHLIRLLLEGIELLKTGVVEYPLQSKQLLLDIKQGKYTLEEVIEMSTMFENILKTEYITSELPDSPDFKLLNELTMDIIVSFLREKKQRQYLRGYIDV